MAKTNKELVSELTASFITSWNSKERTQVLSIDDAKDVFNSFKSLIESMDDNDE